MGEPMSLTVTANEKKGKGVVAVTVTTDGDDDGQTSLMPIEAVILHRLYEGTELTPTAWEEIRSDGALLLATRRGLELLARKPRTERDLRAALEDDFTPPDIDRALARLHELGFLDDRAWSDRYVAGQRAQSRGRSLLRSELRARGIADDVVAEALEDRDELAAALETAHRRARSLRSVPDEAQRRRKLHDFLRRRGFADDVARRATESALASVEV